jgi:hypothetical protein
MAPWAEDQAFITCALENAYLNHNTFDFQEVQASILLHVVMLFFMVPEQWEQTASLKDHAVNILYFVDHTISIMTNVLQQHKGSTASA